MGAGRQQRAQEPAATATDIDQAVDRAEVHSRRDGPVARGAHPGHALLERGSRFRVSGQVVPEATAVGSDEAGLAGAQGVCEVTIGGPAPVLSRYDREAPHRARGIAPQQIAQFAQAVALIVADREEADIEGGVQQTGEGTFIGAEAPRQLGDRTRSICQCIGDAEPSKGAERGADLIATDELREATLGGLGLPGRLRRAFRHGDHPKARTGDRQGDAYLPIERQDH